MISNEVVSISEQFFPFETGEKNEKDCSLSSSSNSRHLWVSMGIIKTILF